MCCFSRPINDVRDTNIFARFGADGLQTIVYSMYLDSAVDVSMILPIPVRRPASEKAVSFIDLSGYEDFFKDMKSGFPAPTPAPLSRAMPKAANTFGPQLEVKKVGSFDASFVPTVADFSRLSPEFRLPEGTWDALPAYKNFGFAVFKLRKTAAKVHPMAFTFPSADPSKLFFPTVHIHDGKVHKKAEFHHDLFCQVAGSTKAMTQWVESPGLAKNFVKVAKTKGIVAGDRHVYRMKLNGELKNVDTLVALA